MQHKKMIFMFFVIAFAVGIGWFVYKWHNGTWNQPTVETISLDEESEISEEQQEWIANYEETHAIELNKKSDIFHPNANKYYVYFHMDGCSHCTQVEPIIDQYILKGALPLYFVNTSTMQLSKEELFQEEAKEGDDYAIIGTPSIAVIENGECIKIYSGVSEIKTLLQKE